jgi:hypothetical protein
MSPFYKSVLDALGVEALLNDLLLSGELRKCFAAKPWAFAVRGGEINSDPRWAPEFGYRYVLKKPKDWVTTVSLSSNGEPVRHFNDEPEFIYCDVSVLDAEWISEDAAWTPEFTNYVHAYFAAKVSVALSAKTATLQTKLGPIAASAPTVAAQTPVQQRAGTFRSDGGSGARLIG